MWLDVDVIEEPIVARLEIDEELSLSLTMNEVIELHEKLSVVLARHANPIREALLRDHGGITFTEVTR